MRFCFDNAALTLDERGFVISFAAQGQEFLPAGAEPQPFLQIGINGRLWTPQKACETENGLLFTFEGTLTVRMSCRFCGEYLAFRVEEAPEQAEVVVFGPYFTSLSDVIGDIVGVVQGDVWALGVQALNAKTLGGFPTEYAGQKSPLAADGTVSELSVASLDYFESAAFSAKAGEKACSLMQLYCENRRRARKKEIMNFRNVPAAPMEDCPDAGIAGAAFALFCCKKEDALDTIGRIEVSEGLPHPLLGGQWAKKSRLSMKSYLIAEFDPENFSELLSRTKQAGFDTLYHPEPFAKWGHFELREDCFPQGDQSLAEYCRAAASEGMRIGLHTLSAFTTPNDGYVTPRPDNRLAKLGKSRVSGNISMEDTEIPVENTEIFQTVTTLQTVQIGEELICYKEERDGVLTGCERGAWGTEAASHESGDEVELLCDHPYRVFFPNLSLQKEYSRRIGSLFAQTGAAQISFDGLEGCTATGEDTYSINRFCLDCWDGWERPDVINDASRLNHNLWHMHTRMNWGEPWGAKMREGMLEYRIKNQDFYRRNLFPRMLGWFLIRKADRKFEATPPEDIEWALSMAAGFDAGFALSTSAAVLSANGCTDELLETIRNWEELRLAGAFPEDLREKLRRPETEWHLEKRGEEESLLYPINLSKAMVCDLLELQPGQPGGADWVVFNPFAGQEYDFRLRVEGNGSIHNPSFVTRGGMLKFSCTVKGGQYLWYRNGKAVITDRNYRAVGEAAPTGKGILAQGQQAFSFSCQFSGEEGPEVSVRVFTKGEPVLLKKFC